MSGGGTPRACCHCGTTEKDLRPYGPSGADVCFVCAMATPARKAQAERGCAAAFDAAGEVVAIGANMSPRAATPEERRAVMRAVKKAPRG